MTATTSLHTINGNPVAAAEVELTITDTNAGDNYQVEAALDPTFSTCFGKTAILTAWKRAYVRLGGMIPNSTALSMAFSHDSNSSDDFVFVQDISVLNIGDDIDIFFPDPANNYTINSISRKIIDIQANRITVADIPHSIPLLGGVKIAGSTGIYMPINFNTVNTNGLEEAYGQNTNGSDGGCFIEFKLSSKPIFHTPKVEYLINDAARAQYMGVWRDATPHDKDNEFLVISAYNSEISGQKNLGGSVTLLNNTIIFQDAIIHTQNNFSFNSPTHYINALSEIIAHEFGHHFGVVPSSYSYVDQPPNTTTYVDKNHEGNDYGIMTYVIGTATSQLFNVKTEFKLSTITHIRKEVDPQ